MRILAMHLPFTARLGALSLALMSCGTGGDRPDQQAGSTSRLETPAGSGGKATTIHLVVGGGPHAGTYDATSDNLTCTYGFAGPGSWGNQYSVTGKSPKEFSSLQLIVPDTKDAADGTDRFLITAAFGEMMKPEYTEYTINTGASLGGSSDDVKKEGSGTITVEDKGKAGKVSFKGKTKDNVTLDGSIDCHQVMRGEG
jgi:hypothetical protein